jgi:hypothetical protein
MEVAIQHDEMRVRSRLLVGTPQINLMVCEGADSDVKFVANFDVEVADIALCRLVDTPEPQDFLEALR